MDVLGVGGGELLVLLGLALVLLGPRRIVGLARDAGALVRQIQTMTDGLTKQLKREVDLLDAVDRRTKPGPKPAGDGAADAEPPAEAQKAELPDAYRRFREDFPEEGDLEKKPDHPAPAGQPPRSAAAQATPAAVKQVNPARPVPPRTSAPAARNPVQPVPKKDS